MEKKRILIVDDEKDFTEIVKFNLEKTGKYEVRTEDKGSNGIAAVRAFKPDLILLDILMPDMDGSDVAIQIKNDESVKDIPIVFLTGVITQKEVDSYGEVISGYPFIAKPVSVESLIDCIEKNIRKY